jgi:hypothetical protein
MRPVLILALITALAAPARAQDPVVFDLTIRGILAGTLSFSGQVEGGRYAVTGRLESAGLVGFLRKVRYDGTAQGSLRGGRFTPSSYREVADTGERQSESVMEYRRGVPQVKLYNPPRPTEAGGLDPASQGGTVDPLTAMFASLRDVPAGQECNRSLTLFDGERRSQIMLGAPRPEQGGVTCAGEYRRLAGFSDRDMARKTRFPFEVRLVPGPEGMMQVAEVTMDSLYGPARLTRR